MQNSELQLIERTDGKAVLAAQARKAIFELETKLKALKKQEEQLRAELVGLMEENNVIKLDAPEFQVLYIPETSKEVFDGKAFRMVHPELYDEFTKLSDVKASVRIRLNG